VEFISGNQAFQGTSINISRNGMQVVVNLPLTHDHIRSITFQVPVPGGKIPIPCRLVRSSPEGNNGDQVLGVEFEYEAEAQLLLIEKFIQDAAVRATEARQLPRTSCRLRNVEINREGVEVLSIDNLSTEGGLISFRGLLHPGDSVILLIVAQDDPRRLRLPGEVVYVMQKAFESESAAGIRFRGLRKSEHTRLKNLVIACCSESALSEMHQLFYTRAASSEHRISGQEEVVRVLSGLCSEDVPLNMLVEGSLQIQERHIVGLRQPEGYFAVPLPINGGMPHVQSGMPHPPAFFSFFWKGCSHYFKTDIAEVTAKELHLHFPEMVFRSDKRSYKRKHLELRSAVRLTPESGGEIDETHNGVLLDISRRGFLCEIPRAQGREETFAVGRSLRYDLDHRLGLGSEGRIRHVKQVHSPRGEALQIGVEAGVARMDCQINIITPKAWSENEIDSPISRTRSAGKLVSLPVTFYNKAGQIIRGLLNISHPGARCPVVVIPPSYGKKKEAFAPLAVTLLANARAHCKPLAVLRFDGVNRPGESHNDITNPPLGYEMLSYRISQGLADLQAALEYVKHNERFRADRIILITFSMSSIDARRLLSQHPKHGVDFWISCMGVPCAQTTLRNVLGGIDIVSNARIGVPNGLMGMLGHFINMDILAQDLLDRKYAFLTDARYDMARISIPVLWISGLYDRWGNQAEVRDIMSVKAPGSREILEVPSGHNLRTSDDAIRAFTIMAAAIHRELYGEVLQPCNPDKQEVVRLITTERERLTSCTPLPSMPDYWRGYLIGNERNPEGYDFYRNIQDFVSFLRAEADLLKLGNRETIADLGCGTGIFLEVLLQNLAKHREPLEQIDIEAYDLVPEALTKAKSKCQAFLSSEPSLRNVRISYRQADLEPNRLLPMARFMDFPFSTLEKLRNKIAGLTSAIIDSLELHSTPELAEFLRGANPEGPLAGSACVPLSAEERATALDFNLAARFLRRRIYESDLKAASRGKRLDDSILLASDLAFRVLDFGNCSNRIAPVLAARHYTAVVASLFISYLFNPEYLLEDCFEALQPRGKILVSSMKPDSDLSVIFINYIEALQRAEWGLSHEQDRKDYLAGARAMLNEAASLFELEESGFFRFYTAMELYNLLSAAGFEQITVRPSMGSPCQAFIAVGIKP
jgi:SAM-dependent methyltransferase